MKTIKKTSDKISKSIIRKTLRGSIWSLVILVAVVLFTKNPTGKVHPVTHNIVASAENMKGHVEFFSQLEGRNPDNPEILKQAEEYVKNEWTKQGYQVEEQKYKVKNIYGTEIEVKNFIVSYNATENPEQKTMIIGSHYDVFENLPGADDNASGMAGLLELTRLVMLHKPKISQRIDFIAYTLEEPPYYDTEIMGSYVHAKSMKESGRNISLMISLEMIGYFSDEPNSQNYPIPYLNSVYPDRGNFIALAGEFGEWFITRKVKTYFQLMTDLPIASINTTKYMQGIDWSDHRSYWEFGYPALLITDTSFLRNRNYHKPTDTAEKLDYKRSAQVVLGTYGILLNYE